MTACSVCLGSNTCTPQGILLFKMSSHYAFHELANINHSGFETGVHLQYFWKTTAAESLIQANNAKQASIHFVLCQANQAIHLYTYMHTYNNCCPGQRNAILVNASMLLSMLTKLHASPIQSRSTVPLMSPNSQAAKLTGPSKIFLFSG